MSNYLPGLNAVRFYAALSVVVVHVTGSNVPGFLSGWNAVSLFFVLSGYLISYRLLLERQRRGYIDLKAFYVRRELRILPLYYLAAFVGGIVLPLAGAPAPTADGLASILLLVPQVGRASSDAALGVIGHLWSIGVEECFYLAFPFLLRFFPFVKLCLAIAGLSVLIGGIAVLGADTPTMLLVKFMRFECMSIGALMAWAVVHRSRWLRAVYHPAAQIAALVVVGSTLTAFTVYPLHDVVFSLACAVFLANISTNPRSLVRLEYAHSRAFGDLTYGVYIWHFPIIWILGNVFAGLPLLASTLAPTLVVAWLSYRYIEAPILRLKSRGFAPREVVVS